jgi:multisubunit Na+/H+ antiporter MnhF subunit
MAKYSVLISLCFFVVLWMWSTHLCGAEMINEVPVNNIPVNEPGTYVGSMPSLLSDREFILSIVAITFGLVVLILEYKLLIRANTSGDQVLKVLIVSTIIVATMFIISAGYTSEQIGPAMGLFGTIAGYLLGRGEKQLFDKQSEKENQ